MYNKKNILKLVMGLIPYILNLIFSLFAIKNGFEIFVSSKIFGIEAFAQSFKTGIISAFPIFLIATILISSSLYKILGKKYFYKFFYIIAFIMIIVFTINIITTYENIIFEFTSAGTGITKIGFPFSYFTKSIIYLLIPIILFCIAHIYKKKNIQ